jgi:uncharacterized membrane protein YcgQ (UPF0703/DUF1980 family)
VQFSEGNVLAEFKGKIAETIGFIITDESL